MLTMCTDALTQGADKDVDVFRSAKVRSVRRQLAAGRYDRDEILDATMERILGSDIRTERRDVSLFHSVSGA